MVKFESNYNITDAITLGSIDLGCAFIIPGSRAYYLKTGTWRGRISVLRQQAGFDPTEITMDQFVTVTPAKSTKIVAEF